MTVSMPWQQSRMLRLFHPQFHKDTVLCKNSLYCVVYWLLGLPEAQEFAQRAIDINLQHLKGSRALQVALTLLSMRESTLSHLSHSQGSRRPCQTLPAAHISAMLKSLLK